MQVIQLKGKDKQLYQLVAPMVMDPEVIRANNNYPFKTGDEYVWYIGIDALKVVGFIPVERKSQKIAIINNYYINAVGGERDELLSTLLSAIIADFGKESWLLHSVTLLQDKKIFEKFEFTALDKKWIRYVKMCR